MESNSYLGYALERKTRRFRCCRWIAMALVAVVMSLTSVTSHAQDRKAEIEGLVAHARKAQDEGDFVQSVKLALEADRAAKANLAEGETPRIQAEVLIGELRARIALNKGELDEALRISNQAVQTSRNKLRTGDPARSLSLMQLADVQLASKQLDRAIASLDLAIRESAQPGAAPRIRFEARLRRLNLKRNAGSDIESELAELFKELPSVLSHSDPLYLFTEQLFGETFFGPVFIGLHGATSTDVETEIDKRLNVVNARLESLGVTADRSAIARLWEARFYWHRQEINSVKRALRKMSSLLAGSSLSFVMRAEYWSLSGLCDSATFHFASSRECHQRALKASQELPAIHHDYRANYLNNLGELLLRQGDYSTARAHLQDAIKIYESPEFALRSGRVYALTNTGKVLEQQGQTRQAGDYHRSAAELAKRLQPPDPFAEALCANNIAMNAYLANELQQAEKGWQEARSLSVKAFGESNVHVAEVEANLGWVAMASQDHSKAEAHFRKALLLLQAYGPDHPRSAEILAYLARTLVHRDQLDEAHARLKEAVELREKYLYRVLRSSVSDRDRLAFVQNLRVHFESRLWPGVLDTYLELAERLSVPAAEQYAHVLAWKGVVERCSIRLPADLQKDEIISGLLTRRDELLRQLRDLHFTDPTTAENHAATLFSLEAEADSVERQIAARAQQQGIRIETKDLLPESISQSLRPDEVLVDVIQTRAHQNRWEEHEARPECYVGFVVHPGNRFDRVDFGTAELLNEAIVALHKSLKAGYANFDIPAARVARLFQDPLALHMQNAKVLIVAGDDLVHRLPLAVLPSPKTNTRYWIENLAFASVPSAQSFVARRNGPRAPAEGLLVAAAIDYGKPLTPESGVGDGGIIVREVPPLKATRSEADSLIAMFKERFGDQRVDLRDGADADEVTILGLLAGKRYVHLATHGFFLGGVYEANAFETFGAAAQFDSALVMAGFNQASNGQDQDCLITSEELKDIDLRGCQLLVLSACETGLGHVAAGQGVIGLAGALDRTGVQTVVSALWKAADVPTALIMEQFYQNLWSTEDPVGAAEALRRAQCAAIFGELVTPKGTKIQHPRYWAPFIVSGNPAAEP